MTLLSLANFIPYGQSSYLNASQYFWISSATRHIKILASIVVAIVDGTQDPVELIGRFSTGTKSGHKQNQAEAEGGVDQVVICAGDSELLLHKNSFWWAPISH